MRLGRKIYTLLREAGEEIDAAESLVAGAAARRSTSRTT